MKAKKSIIYSLLFGTALAFSAGAHASLTLLGPIDEVGTGLGAVDTILTLQSPGNTTNETGSVAWNGSTDVVTGDTIAINQTLTFADLNVQHASEIVIVFNPVEPGNTTDNSITLTDLRLNIFSPTGTALFSSGQLAGAPLTFPTTDLGTGKAGFAFALDATQAAAAELAAFGVNFNSLNRIGLQAVIDDATGGHETFFGLTAPIPEPETYAMMLAGLGLMGFVARRREKSLKTA
jgi:hypothetical protein